jgi:hypothetical protein
MKHKSLVKALLQLAAFESEDFSIIQSHASRAVNVAITIYKCGEVKIDQRWTVEVLTKEFVS